MLKMIRERMQDDKGFTLIELMVVVLIIAILLAIAIPTFLRIRRSAQDRAAQSSVTEALKSEEAFYNQGFEVFTSDGGELEEGESSINYASAVAPTCAGFANEKCVQVTLEANDVDGELTTVVLVAKSANGTYWAVRDVEVDQTATQVGTFYNTGGDTTAALAAAGATGDEW